VEDTCLLQTLSPMLTSPILTHDPTFLRALASSPSKTKTATKIETSLCLKMASLPTTLPLQGTIDVSFVPPELGIMIAENLGLADLKSLRLVCRSFNRFFTGTVFLEYFREQTTNLVSQIRNQSR